MHHYRWYAVYTHFNEETLLLEHLLEQGFEAYMPMRRYPHITGTKRKYLYEPLFKSHVFVRTTPAGLQDVKKAPGYSHMVRFGKYLAAIPESQIVKVKTIVYHYEDVTAVSTSSIDGVPVAVVSGPLKGLVGTLTHGEGERPVAMEIGQLGQSILVQVPMKTIFRTQIASAF